ncbi:hypothetical protein ACLOJK_000603 [Asimina triloba]
MASLLCPPSSSFFFFFFLGLPAVLATSTKQTYLVHMNQNHQPLSHPTHAAWYAHHLQSLSINPSAAILYTYHTVLSGFAAALDASEAEALRRSHSVIRIDPDTVYQIHTTRTPDFLGLNANSGDGKQAHFDKGTEDIIIGLLDTGVWPQSPSFDDRGMPAIPLRWRGKCERGPDFGASACNKKLIGARSFWKGAYPGGKPQEKISPCDRRGHGTHTASTAAGSRVANASLFGYGLGTARGMAHRSRLAEYKVCWDAGCSGSDILAAMDAAIADGVDVLSISLGSGRGLPYNRDPIAIGSFAAVGSGIFVTCSAGNEGPDPGYVANIAPWIMTVAAGSLDRSFQAYVGLGDGQKFTGETLYSGRRLGSKPLRLVYNVSEGALIDGISYLCEQESLSSKGVGGKVVVCDGDEGSHVRTGVTVKKAGGAGMILVDMSAEGAVPAESDFLPTVTVGKKTGEIIKEYIRSTRNPTAVLDGFGRTVLNVKPSPMVAAFSSRGPNSITPEILKPDLFGPGVNILAGWSGFAAVTGASGDKRKSKYNVISGTSMSCPHIAGVAALVKAAHPSWSPSAIKSALITTAYGVDNTKSPIRDAAAAEASTPFAHGAGHVNPQKAISPGLVYDISADDYVAFVCRELKSGDVKTVIRNPNVTCTRKLSSAGSLNYPSFSVVFGDKRKLVEYSREVTNVGPANSAYDAAVDSPQGFDVAVKPKKLVFSQVGQKLGYSVTFALKKTESWNEAFGSITWSNPQFQVKSPVAFLWNDK